MFIKYKIKKEKRRVSLEVGGLKWSGCEIVREKSKDRIEIQERRRLLVPLND